MEATTAPILMSDNPSGAENPIFGFNVIEVVKARSTGHNTDTIQTVSAAFSLTAKTAQMVLKLILVRTGCRRIFLSANKVITIRLPAHVGAKFKGQEILFTPSELHTLPHSLEVTEGLVKTKTLGNTCHHSHREHQQPPHRTQPVHNPRPPPDSENCVSCRQ